MKMRSMIVSLIGRPNVGKSTIFNRLVRDSYRAIAHNKPGVTRDRHYAITTIDEVPDGDAQDIIIVDTGGFYPEKVRESSSKEILIDPFIESMADHAKLAIEESDLVLFVMDVREGLLPHDEEIYRYLLTTGKTFWLLLNKFDSDKQWGEEGEFYGLGVDQKDLYITSAEHGRGLSSLRESIHRESLKFQVRETNGLEHDKGVVPNFEVVGNIAMIGAPNVGKSTMLNKLVGSQRALVSNVAGTTVDPIEGYLDIELGINAKLLKIQHDIYIKSNQRILENAANLVEEEEELSDRTYIGYGETVPEELAFETLVEKLEKEEAQAQAEAEALDIVKDLEVENLDVEVEQTLRSVKLVDTAGIRRNAKVKEYIESHSVYRSLRAISEADIVIVMVDATQGILHQDRRLMDITLEKGKSIIIALNKFDLLKEKLKTHKEKEEWMLDLRFQVPWLSFCELIPISAKYNKGLGSLRKSIIKTLIVRNKMITTSKLNRCVHELVEKNPVTIQGTGGSKLNIKYASMVKAAPPTFLLMTNKSKNIPMNFRKYLSKGIRKEFELVNTPVHLVFRTTAEMEGKRK